ncbi:hypothetical protein HYALB_00008670 [Hymenoscyphus albidus]|uniref:Secreted protein n=1 Tax=Hymenoscyphus albidus TaxID=595503 RepID=A0A9N9Q2V6_9HELO|nr:hypothetical protein HYALB_00008670 [Hymenoscyphus albidus]
MLSQFIFNAAALTFFVAYTFSASTSSNQGSSSKLISSTRDSNTNSTRISTSTTSIISQKSSSSSTKLILTSSNTSKPSVTKSSSEKVSRSSISLSSLQTSESTVSLTSSNSTRPTSSSTSTSRSSVTKATSSSTIDTAKPGSSTKAVLSPTSSSENPTTTSKATSSSVFPTPPQNVVITSGPDTITLGPQTSTETGNFESKQTSISGLIDNSATTTSRDGHNTILPIWFLSDDIGIIKLPPANLPVGGIIPPPPGFPPLFIGSDGKPTAAGPPEGTKDPQTTSQDKPTSTNDSKTSENPTSTEQTTTKATSSTSSTISTSSSSKPTYTASCGTCINYQGDGESVPADNGGNDSDDSNTSKRSLAGRIHIPLHKRADDFDTFNPGTSDACQLAQRLKIPNYPTPPNLPKKAGAGADMWWIMTEVTAPNTCPVLDYRKVTDSAVESERINPADANAYKKGGDWSQKDPTVNVDHVYELSILKQYFSSRINSKNCKEFKSIFDVADKGTPQINAIKAQFFSNAFSNPSGGDKNLAYVYELAIAMKLTNDKEVSPIFKKTNNRIYAALLGMDALIDAANCGSSTTPIIIGDWASEYEKWITNLLNTAGTNVNSKISAILSDNNKLGPSARVGPGSTTGADGIATATTNSVGNGVSAFLQAYPTPNAFTLDVGALLEFPTTSTLVIKRQACSKPISSGATSTSVPPETSSPTNSTSTPIESTVTETSQPPSTTVSSIAQTSTSTSSAPLPTSCPDGCTCTEAPEGGCFCLCARGGKF